MKSVNELMRLATDAINAEVAFQTRLDSTDAFEAMAEQAALLGDVQDTLIALHSALEEVVRDAARYRWLRGGKPRTAGRPRANALEVIQWEGANYGDVLKGDALDAAIDAAMAKEHP